MKKYKGFLWHYLVRWEFAPALSLESKIREIRWFSWWNSDYFRLQLWRHDVTWFVFVESSFL